MTTTPDTSNSPDVHVVPRNNMATVVKFIPRKITEEDREKGRIPVKTRTCMKIGLIDDYWSPSEGMDIPQVEEWWLVHIVYETRIGRNRGCLLVRPVKRVFRESLLRLIPGFYETERPNPATMIVTPKDHPHTPWIMPLRLKKELMHKLGLATLVVNLGGEYWGRDGEYWGRDDNGQ